MQVRIVHHIYQAIFQIRATKGLPIREIRAYFFSIMDPADGSYKIFMKFVNNSLHNQQSSWIWISGVYELYHESVDEFIKTHEPMDMNLAMANPVNMNTKMYKPQWTTSWIMLNIGSYDS